MSSFYYGNIPMETYMAVCSSQSRCINILARKMQESSIKVNCKKIFQTKAHLEKNMICGTSEET